MLNTQDSKDRRIRAAIREYNDLSAKRHITIDLDEPIQRGWRRFFVLSDHAARRRDAETLRAILAIIGTERISRRLDFKTRQCGTKRMIEIEQSVRRIRDREWTARGLSGDWFRYFHIQRYSQWGRPAFRAEFSYPSLFELRTEPRWILQVQGVDPEIESRLSELENWLKHCEGWERWGWLKGRRQQWRWGEQDTDRHRYLSRLHAKTIRNAMHGEVEPAAPAWCRRFSRQCRRPPKVAARLPHRRPLKTNHPPDFQNARVAQLYRVLRFERSGCRLESCREHHFPDVAQCRGIRLRSGKVWVRVLPSGPISRRVSRQMNSKL